MIGPILDSWKADAGINDNITAWQTYPAVAAQWEALPAELHPALAAALRENHIDRLYHHQLEAWQRVRQGENIVVTTGTSSGKTWCYNLSILDRLLTDGQARAMYLFPTKALAQDQLQNLQGLISQMGAPARLIHPGIYDGDTPTSQRSSIRSQSHLILTNPDMIHTGILPHHTLWAEFFRNLQFIVIDEIHIYRGVFGSHVANVLRRLKRIAAFYGSQPQFILTSATVANPLEHANRLVEVPLTLIDQDGSPHGEKNFIIYNPPMINREIGLRRSAFFDSVALAKDLLDHNVQTLLFSRTRKAVELLLTYLRGQVQETDNVRGYRSGYLPSDRREIEHELRLGTTRAVVATNALELGIDIGGIDAVLMVGYPGTVASTRQQAGRAGRKTETSLAVLVASPDPLDQFLARHPEFLFGHSPEQALIKPDHLLILLNHIRCAAFELPFQKGDAFGDLPPEKLLKFLEFLRLSGFLHEKNGRYYWMADQYPSNDLSIRSSSSDEVLLQVEADEGLMQTIGKVDLESAYWMVHPDAVYIHEGQPYLVTHLDLEKNIAFLRPHHLDYYTEPIQETTVEKTSELKHAPISGGGKSYGDLKVTHQVTAYRQIKWTTHEVVGVGALAMPTSQLVTCGFWFWLDEATIDQLQKNKLWTNSPNDYGPFWPAIRQQVMERDRNRCQVCGALQMVVPFHVHHKKPFRTFLTTEAANQLDNLITVCPTCHRKVEQAVRMRSGLAGLAYSLGKLAPLFLMCAENDLGVTFDPQSQMSDGQPTVVIYDNIPAGIGLSEHLYDVFDDLVAGALETVSTCDCADGCPACIGPGGEEGSGGKKETLALLSVLSPKGLKV